MMSMRTTLAAVLAMLAFINWERPAIVQAPAELSVLITAHLLEQRPGVKNPIKMGEMTVIASEGRFSYMSGGEIPSKLSQDKLQFGTIAKGTVTRQKNSRFMLDMTYSLGEQPPQPEETELVTSQTLRLRTLFKDGETKKFRFSKSQSCEIKLQKMGDL